MEATGTFDSIGLFAAGAGLTLLVLYDFLRTTISMAGFGPLSALLTRVPWWVMRFLVRRLPAPFGPRLRAAIGPAILSLLGLFWITAPMVGYAMMFASGPGLQISEIEPDVTLAERIAFVGASLSTLGSALAEPRGGWWDILAMAGAVNGMVVLTLSVSFVLTVLQTTAEARTMALRVNALLPPDARDNRDQALKDLARIGPDLCLLAVKLAHAPLASYFATRERERSFPLAVVTLCDMLERPEEPNPDTSGCTELLHGLKALPPYRGRDQTASLGVVRRWAEQLTTA